MGREYSVEFHGKAVGMVLAGMDRKAVCKRLGISRTQLYVWLKREKAGEGLKSKPGRGRKSSVHPVVKRVIAMSVTKRRRSTRKLAKRLTAAGYPVSHGTVHTYLRKNLNVKPYKPSKRPKLTKKQQNHRLEFAKERKNWTEKDWQRVLWSDESPFELFHPPNRQNDRVWAGSASEVPAVQTVKHPAKVHVWGMMSYRAVSELHVVPQKVTVTGEYYRENILKNECRRAITRKAKTGTILERSLVPDGRKVIFMQDGAPAHTARETQEWCRNNFPSFWARDIWPGNSPDLNPIENLWAILQEKVNELPPATSVEQLTRQLKEAWAGISPTVLHNLTAGMPERMRECIANKGGYIGK